MWLCNERIVRRILSCNIGLDLQKDTVIEIACLITDGRLKDPVEASLCFLTATNQKALDQLYPF